MNKRMKYITLVSMVSTMAVSGVAFAHGTEHHHASANEMKKLHAMMPMFSTASTILEKAIDAGDTASAKTAAKQILTAIPDLKKTTPHKNAKQKKKYVELAANLEQAVISTVDMSKQGDKAGAKAAFKKVETACAACHEKFRD